MSEHPFPKTLFLPDHSSTHPPLFDGLDVKGMDVHVSSVRFEEFMMYELTVRLGYDVCYEYFDHTQVDGAQAFAQQNSSEMLEKLQHFDFSLVREVASEVLKEGEFWVKARPAMVDQGFSMRTPWFARSEF